jgi:hypothetical protein
MMHRQATIASGAILRGVHGIKPTEQKSRQSYGYSVAMPFRPGIDAGRDEFYCLWHNAPYCRERMDWLITFVR